MKYIISAAILLWLSVSCTKNKDKEKAVLENFPITSAELIDTAVSKDYVTEILAVQNVEIRARVKGYLDKIYIDEGKYVQQGQLLFGINSAELKEQLAKAKASLKSAQAELKTAEIEMTNMKNLAETKVVGETQLELAKSKVELMRAHVEEAIANESTARISLSYADIRAPFSGIINRIPNKIGSLIEEGTLLTTISKNDEVYAYFDVSEKEYLNFMTNMAADNQMQKNISLIMANEELHPYKGSIETTEAEIEQGTGNIAFRARFANPQKLLKHGSSGKVRLMKKYNKALIIPQKATFEIQDRIYVYVVDNKNQVKSRPITISNRMTHYYIVDSGLSQTDKILYEGLQNVKEGMTIKPQFMPMAKIKADLASK